MRTRFQGWEYDAVYQDCIARYPNICNTESYQGYLQETVAVARQMRYKDDVVKFCEEVMNGALIRGNSIDCQSEFCAAYDIRTEVYNRMSQREIGRCQQ